MDPHRRFRASRLAEILVAKLRHHVRMLPDADIFLVVLRPQKSERNAGFCQFRVNVLVIRIHISRHFSVLLGEKNALKDFIADVVIKRPFDSLAFRRFQHFADGVVRPPTLATICL